MLTIPSAAARTGFDVAGRFLSALAVSGLLLAAPGVLPAAMAQSEQVGIDPPGRVGRLARVTGTVSFHTAEQTEWQPASLNFPVTSGQAYWTEPAASAEIEIGGSRVVLDHGTEIDLEKLDDHTFSATLPQGNVYVALNQMDPGDSVTLRTPRGTVTLGQAGRYVVETGDTAQPTAVTVLDGRAQVFGPGVSLAVGPHQTARITGTETFQGNIGPQAADPFVTANAPPPRPLPTGTYAPPVAVSQMTGGEALVETGTWDSSPEYGQVWYPPVDAGWVPYRHGHWAYVMPWGWTWVDDAPWGFAPFHYGRWAQFGPRWGWVPGSYEGEYRRPVYAPALVAFVGFGAGVAIGASFGSPVGWIPLGPREAYRPTYRASPAYERNVNITHVTNVTNNNFTNRGAATVVPASAMTNSQSVARSARMVSPQTLGNAQPLTTMPVRPTQATLGVGRQPGLAAGPAGAPVPRVAPGPAFSPRPQGTAPTGLPQFQRQPSSVPQGSVPQVGQPGGQRPGGITLPTAQPGGQQPQTFQRPAQQPVAPTQAAPRPAQQPAVPMQAAPRPMPQVPQVQHPSAQPVQPQSAAPVHQAPPVMPHVQPAPQAPLHQTPQYQAPAARQAPAAPAPQQHYQAPQQHNSAPAPQHNSGSKSCPPGHPNC